MLAEKYPLNLILGNTSVGSVKQMSARPYLWALPGFCFISSSFIFEGDMTESRYHKLMLITNRKDAPLDEYLEFIRVCADSGITSLQLREKSASYNFLLEFGSRLKEILAPYNIPLIVNDNVELAVELDAHGIHLGQTDGDPKTVLATGKHVGISIDSYENLMNANSLAVDYVGVGAIFETLSKTNVTTIWGVEGLKRLALLSKHPIIAIGGINEFNVLEIMSAGADGIAVINAIHGAESPGAMVKKLRSLIEIGGDKCLNK